MLVIIKIQMARSTAVFGKIAIAKHVASADTVSRKSTTVLNSVVTVAFPRIFHASKRIACILTCRKTESNSH